MVQRGTQHLTEMRRIAERALELIEDGDTIREATDTVRVLFMGSLVRRNYHCTVIHGSASRDILAGLRRDALVILQYYTRRNYVAYRSHRKTAIRRVSGMLRR